MIQKVAVLNDLSGFGKCSLSAALPVLSVLGVQCCPLATAVLTGQTGYEHYYCTDLTGMMPQYINAWKQNRVEFNGIYSGYLTGQKQIAYVMEFLSAFRTKDTFLLVDPVMGDDGRVYGIYSDELLAGMRTITAQADMITPNLMEACLLAGKNYQDYAGVRDKTELIKRTEELGHFLQHRGKSHQEVIITGIKYRFGGQAVVLNLAAADRETFSMEMPYLERSFSGTGDLFASAMCGMHLRGVSTKEALPIVCDFLYESISDAIANRTPGNEGISFEKYLHKIIAPQTESI